MKIYFGTSTTKFDENMTYYGHAINIIKKREGRITLDWISLAKNDNDFLNKFSRASNYKSIITAISKSDATIFDCSVPSMNLGHQITYAAMKDIPTLLISRYKGEDINNLLISGMESDVFYLKNYTSKDEIGKYISDFIRNISNRKKRINVILDKKQIDYLQWLSYFDNTNITSILKKMINNNINNDKYYQEKYKEDLSIDS